MWLVDWLRSWVASGVSMADSQLYERKLIRPPTDPARVINYSIISFFYFRLRIYQIFEKADQLPFSDDFVKKYLNININNLEWDANRHINESLRLLRLALSRISTKQIIIKSEIKKNIINIDYIRDYFISRFEHRFSVDEEKKMKAIVELAASNLRDLYNKCEAMSI